MLLSMWIVAGLLLLVWMLGVGGAFVVGSAINFVLVLAVMVIAASMFTRPRTI